MKPIGRARLAAAAGQALGEHSFRRSRGSVGHLTTHSAYWRRSTDDDRKLSNAAAKWI